jgi:serine/threonine protein phosphatase PrpC
MAEVDQDFRFSLIRRALKHVSWCGSRWQSTRGSSAGNSRLYLFDREGELRILTDTTKRLGSGHAEAFVIRHSFRSGEILLLMSDGVYGPLSLYALKKALAAAASRHFSELPESIVNAAKSREDDATVVALRLR